MAEMLFLQEQKTALATKALLHCTCYHLKIRAGRSQPAFKVFQQRHGIPLTSVSSPTWSGLFLPGSAEFHAGWKLCQAFSPVSKLASARERSRSTGFSQHYTKL